MTQIRGVTSEALEARVRELLPSQAGFTEELSAQNLIVPTIDLTSAAEGATTGQNLQVAWDFATGFDEVTSSTTVISTTGFWKVDLTTIVSGGFNGTWNVSITDGSTSKTVWQITTKTSTVSNLASIAEGHFVVFLRSGDSLTAGVTGSTNYPINIWYRQIADVNGTLVNPLGFTPQ